MTEHAVSVVILGDGRYRATCACNWRMAPTINRPTAEAQAEQHLEYRRDVGRITAAPAAAHRTREGS